MGVFFVLLMLGSWYLDQRPFAKLILGRCHHCGCSSHHGDRKWVALHYSRVIDTDQCFCGVVDEALWTTMACRDGQNGKHLRSGSQRWARYEFVI